MKYITLFGRITLLAGFVVILVCALIHRKASFYGQHWRKIEREIDVVNSTEEVRVLSTTFTQTATTRATTQRVTTSQASTSSVKPAVLVAGPPPSARNQSEAKERNVFYNRIGKCGSRSLFQVISSIARFNHFRVKFSDEYGNESPPPREAHVEMVKIARLAPPTLYNRHIHYLDFKKYGFEQPIYINMIRDPIARFTSHYNYLKYGDESGKVKKPQNGWDDISKCVMEDHPQCRDGKMMFYMGLYFCGLEEICKKASKARVEFAKKHIDEEYYAIGTLEDFNNTLRLFEKMLPNFFRGARSVWNKHKKSWQRNSKTKTKDFLTEEAKHKLREDNLAEEYEVYEHAKRKFERLKQEHGIS